MSGVTSQLLLSHRRCHSEASPGGQKQERGGSGGWAGGGCRAGGCPGSGTPQGDSGEQPGQDVGLCLTSEPAGHGEPRPGLCEDPTSPSRVSPQLSPGVLGQGQLYCSYSSVHNPSSDPVPHLNEGSGWGWGRLRESKISAELFAALTKAAHHAWGEALWVRLGFASWCRQS